MFGRFLGWYTIYTFSGALTPDEILPRAKFTLRPKSCVLPYWQRYCGVVQGMELRNFPRRRHLYSARRPSCSASAHISSYYYFTDRIVRKATRGYLIYSEVNFRFSPRVGYTLHQTRRNLATTSPEPNYGCAATYRVLRRVL